MAGSLSEIIRNRKAVLRQLEQSMRLVDTKVESVQRGLKRLRGRKIKVPEASDLLKVQQIAVELDTSWASFTSKFAEAVNLFKAV